MMLSHRANTKIASSAPRTQAAPAHIHPAREKCSHSCSTTCVVALPSAPSTPVLGPKLLQHHRAKVQVRGFVGGSSLATTDDGQPMRVATIGDTVTLHFTFRDSNGKILQSSREEDCPLTFEVGAGDIIGNRLFQGFDEAVRGLAEGETTEIEATGGEWKADLLFAVPRDHPEMQRLEGKYKNQGGLKDGMIVELANMQLASILEVTDTTVKLDCNSLMAGQHLFINLEVVGLNRVDDEPAKAVPEAQ
mmetsp:Transcript_739/g.1838  ORF Transcript_739/g.1838 Transcript_739/m.1838 type:complete len:248 (-) Transcript_739:54-797(-)|eukprot:CAMPEP_0202368158 /NCGR_PEP_ID=MMETSP1127-20130417/336_1 /ASSEMBLY_ACC=CAM_ASM_000462 /TAXON_ID=3047 /ORGANISM="Dunaliella tertiolecta, Strain CCMP1320" /LENGTH=247 /DNA_ID=CAMNT_0048963525 /DNA_START=13 /DNA_END=756 /DNA_ORIENTATION=+